MKGISKYAMQHFISENIIKRPQHVDAVNVNDTWPKYTNYFRVYIAKIESVLLELA